MQTSPPRLCVVLLPFLGHGHFNAYLRLARMLAIAGASSVVYVTLPSNLELLEPRFSGAADLPSPVHFQALPVPNPPLPPGRQNLNRVPRSMLPKMFALIDAMREPLETLLAAVTGDPHYHESRRLPPPDRVALVYDLFMGWSAASAAKFGVPAFNFNPMSAHFCLCMKAMFCPGEAAPPPEITAAVDITSLPDSAVVALRRHVDFTRRLAGGVIVNTFPEMEPRFLRLLENDAAPVWAVGPVVELPGRERDGDRDSREAEVLTWLDGQQPGSVVYVSFGTESYVPPAQVRELAAGLEASGQPFILVLRRPESELEGGGPAAQWDCDLLPGGEDLFKRRLAGRCLIETRWAPQTAILGHVATGGFISHCGWNSALESMAAGVPMIAMPVQSDQPANALLLTRETRVALELKASDDGVVRSDEVARVVKRLLWEEEGAETRRRVEEVRKALIKAVADEDGGAWKNLRLFIKHVQGLNQKRVYDLT